MIILTAPSTTQAAMRIREPLSGLSAATSKDSCMFARQATLIDTAQDAVSTELIGTYNRCTELTDPVVGSAAWGLPASPAQQPLNNCFSVTFHNSGLPAPQRPDTDAAPL